MARMETPDNQVHPVLAQLVEKAIHLTVQDLSDITHPINDKAISGKRAGAGVMIDETIYIALGSAPDAKWRIVGGAGSADSIIDTTNLPDNAILKWDDTTGKLVDSGVRSDETGSLTIEPSTLHVGAHDIESSAENVLFTNTATGKTYAPVWQLVEPGSETATFRKYGAKQEFTVQADDSQVITNPDYSLTAQDDSALLSSTIKLAEDAEEVIVRIFLASKLLWMYRAGDLTAGEHKLTFSVPSDFKQGTQYRITITSATGADVKLLGDANGEPYNVVERMTYETLTVADRAWVLANAQGGGEDPVVDDWQQLASDIGMEGASTDVAVLGKSVSGSSTLEFTLPPYVLLLGSTIYEVGGLGILTPFTAASTSLDSSVGGGSTKVTISGFIPASSYSCLFRVFKVNVGAAPPQPPQM